MKLKFKGFAGPVASLGVVSLAMVLTLFAPVISKRKQIYESGGGMTKEEMNLLTQTTAEPLVITPKNANFLLNVLWPLGIPNKNPILDEMSKYGSVGNLASTGGWTLAKGEAMEHFNKLELVKLNTGQQAVFEEVAKNTYWILSEPP